MTMQSIIGMNYVFRGWITKNWVDIRQQQPKKMHTINKMIIKHSVKFYSEAWRHRNKIRHDPVKYKEFIIKWYHNVNEMIKEDNRPEVLKYARMQQLDLDQTEVAYIRQWIIGVMNMR